MRDRIQDGLHGICPDNERMDLPSADTKEGCGTWVLGTVGNSFREISFERTPRFQVEMLSLICECGVQERGLIWGIIDIKMGG